MPGLIHMKQSIQSLSIVLVAICAFILPGVAHGATLLDRVNEALMAAGLPVTAASQQSFAACVVNGHYKSFAQMVNAMKWHKEHNRMLADCAPTKLWTFKGVVTEVNTKKIEISGQDKHQMLVTKKFTLTPKTKVRNGVILFDITSQQRTDIGNVIQRGSSAKVWYNSHKQAVVIMNLANSHDDAAFFGPIDCPTCQGGSNHVDPVITNENQGD
jgi:hypothetical protein